MIWKCKTFTSLNKEPHLTSQSTIDFNIRLYYFVLFNMFIRHGFYQVQSTVKALCGILYFRFTRFCSIEIRETASKQALCPCSNISYNTCCQQIKFKNNNRDLKVKLRQTPTKQFKKFPICHFYEENYKLSLNKKVQCIIYALSALFTNFLCTCVGPPNTIKFSTAWGCRE